MAGVKVSKRRDEPAPAAARRGGLRGLSWDPEPLRRLGRGAAANLTPAGLWRKHRLFTLLVMLAIVPRVLAALAFRPAELIPDSFSYMQEGVHLSPPGMIRPAGYSILLRVLEPFHSLLVVTTLQHLMGIAVAVIVYGLLRSKGLPGWGASLATVPTLFDPRQIWLESSILPDTLFGLAIIIAVAILLTERVPVIWQCAVAGLLVAYASILRGNGGPVIVAILAFMLFRRVGWRAFVAGLVAFAIPLLGYVGLFHSDYGQFDITNSSGMFLWSRTMSFANCAVIKPPPDLAPLCPDAQPHHGPAQAPPWSVGAVLDARSPADYLWASGAWWRHDAHPGINAYNNKLAMRFAIDAIKAQPLDYLRVTGRDVMLTFLATDRPQSILALDFTTKPDLATLPPNYIRDLQRYAHTSSNTHPVQPYAYLLLFYQLPVYFPGFAYFLVITAGLVGVVRSWWRRRRPEAGLIPWTIVALPWSFAVIIIVVAPALHEYLYRYAISAVPVACLAAGLAFVRRPPQLALTGPAGPADLAAHVYPPQETVRATDAPLASQTVPDPQATAAPQETSAPQETPAPQAASAPQAPSAAQVISASQAPSDPQAASAARATSGPEAPPDFDTDTDPGWASLPASRADTPPEFAPGPNHSTDAEHGTDAESDADTGPIPKTPPAAAPHDGPTIALSESLPAKM